MKGEVKLTTRETLAVLRAGPFRRFVIGSAISDTGTWMQVMAQGWIMSTLTTSALLLGLVNFSAGLPMLALTMVGGAAADRFDKRKILLATQFVQIALAIAIGLLIWSHRIQIWHIFIFAALLGTSNSFEMPTLSAFVPELVEKKEIQGAVAIDRAVFHASRLVGPALAGAFVAIWGAASAFFCNAVSFVALIVAILTIPPRRRGTAEEEEKRGGGMKEGFLFIRQDKPSLAMVALIATTTVFIFPIISVMMPLYVRNVLHLGADSFGYLMAASAIGSVVGALFLLSIPRDKRIPLMIVFVGIVTCAVFGLSLATTFRAAMGLLIANSLGLSMNFGMANTIVQERAPDYLRGRVSAVFGLSFFGLMPIAGLVITEVSDLIGMRRALMTGSILYGIVGLTVLFRVLRQCRQPGVSEIHGAGTPPPPVVAAV